MAVVIDADGLILGRLCTHVAKKIRNGDEVVVLNAEKAVISGNREQLQEFYLHRRHRGSSQSKAKGPKYPRTADRILKRTVRGMIEYRKPWGRDAYKRLRVYVGVPKEYKDSKAETIESAKKPHLDKYVHLGDITKHLGAKEV